MGKYMKKAKMAGEVAVMDVSQSSLGVRTRAKTLALQKLSTTTTSSAPSATATNCYLQLRSRRLLKVSVEPKRSKEATCKDCPDSRLVCVSTSPLNSLGTTRRVGGIKELATSAPGSDKGSQDTDACVEVSFGDNVLEVEARERSVRETTPSNLVRGSETLGTPGSTNRPTNSTVTKTRNAAHRSIPTTHEMEEFFAGAERQQQRIFTEKYNYDPVNDLPLPGRYEWVRLD